MDINIEIQKQPIIRELIPPITKVLTGIAKFKTSKTDKELLLDALKKKYLQTGKGANSKNV